jgi:hypothetical protein
MAIQNFLSGGFYGKLGDVVGQRWKNKRTIRSYVIPLDPKTEKQLLNREQFALAVELAQEAMALNKGCSAWKTNSKPEFSLRVSTAKLRIQTGASPEIALPLFPDGDFEPVEFFLTEFYTNTTESKATIYISVNAPKYPFEFGLSLVGINLKTGLYELFNTSGKKWDPFNKPINVNSKWDFVFPEGSYAMGFELTDYLGGKLPVVLYPTPISETIPATRKTTLSVTDYTLQPEALTLFMKSENDIFFDFDKKTNIDYKMFDTSSSSIVTKNNGELKYIGFNTFILTLPSHNGCLFSQGSETIYSEFTTNLDLANISVVLPVIELEYSTGVLYISISNMERYWKNCNLRFNYSGNTTGESFPFIYKAYVLNIYTQLYETVQLEGEISEIGSGQEDLVLDWKYLFDDNSYISGYGVSPTTPKETNVLLSMTQYTEAKPFIRMGELNYETDTTYGGKFAIIFTLDKPSFPWVKKWTGMTFYLWSTSQNELIEFETGEIRTNASTTFVFEGLLPAGYTLTHGAGVETVLIEFEEEGVSYIIESTGKTFD